MNEQFFNNLEKELNLEQNLKEFEQKKEQILTPILTVSPLIAEVQRDHFENLIAMGFSEQQALYLVSKLHPLVNAGEGGEGS